MTAHAPLAVGLREAADLAGVSTDTVRRAIHATEPPYLKAKRVGARFAIKVSDLEDWLDSLPDA
jgi:excisionase family DNA binding protein